MLTFSNSPELKAMYVSRVKSAIERNNMITASFGAMTSNGWQGCLVGVLSHRSEGNESFSELSEIGLPQSFTAYIPDIFDNLSIEERNKFSIDFIESIPVGVKISRDIEKEISFVYHKIINNAEVDASGNLILPMNSFLELGKIMIDALRALTPEIVTEKELSLVNI